MNCLYHGSEHMQEGHCLACEWEEEEFYRQQQEEQETREMERHYREHPHG